MKLVIKREGIETIPEDFQDEAYLTSLDNNGFKAKLVRVERGGVLQYSKLVIEPKGWADK